jgi:hypothetical protein
MLRVGRRIALHSFRSHTMQTTVQSLSFEVDGLPPAKSEAQSMLGARHPHAPRVLALLRAAAGAAADHGGAHFGSARLGMEVVLTLVSDRPSDLTNYAGGIADVLEEKGRRTAVDHLGELALVALYDNDRQLCDVRVREQPGPGTSYCVHLWVLQPSTGATSDP